MAAQPDTVGRYPQSTPDGEAIPFEIVRPYGLLFQAFSNVAVDDVAIPAGAGFLVLRAVGGSCVVVFGSGASIPADGTHSLGAVYIGDGEVEVIDHNAATTFGVIRWGSTDGTLIVQTCSKYTDVRKSAQLDRS